MKTKRVIILLIILLAFVFLMIIYGKNKTETENQEGFSAEAVESFTANYFRFLEKLNIEENDEGVAISISFVPEVGSIIIKEDIYQEVAWHALQIVSLFPGVNYFEYIILWDDYSKQEALKLVIDSQAIEKLERIYFEEKEKDSNGLETSYKNVFSTIIESEISKTWRERIDPNTDLP